jgi:hypothetical protein
MFLFIFHLQSSKPFAGDDVKYDGSAVRQLRQRKLPLDQCA